VLVSPVRTPPSTASRYLLPEAEELLGYWYWKHNGVDATGNLTFHDDGSISSTTVTDAPWKGWWKNTDDGMVEVNFGVVTHVMKLSEDKQELVLITPVRDPPSKATRSE